MRGMIRTGTFCKCERCGLEEFFEDNEMLGDSSTAVATSAWKMIDGKHTCQNCASEYRARMDIFWNEFLDK